MARNIGVWSGEPRRPGLSNFDTIKTKRINLHPSTKSGCSRVGKARVSALVVVPGDHEGATKKFHFFLPDFILCFFFPLKRVKNEHVFEESEEKRKSRVE